MHIRESKKMITGDDLYKVMCAMVPLYFAMLIAYASVKWCKIFTPAQCSGINRFVAVFAVPVLSFHFISDNNPYHMHFKFIIADTISKLLLLLFLSMWALLSSGGSLDWLITLFSLSSLPNTLIMGIPLLQAMYGPFTQSLMVQLLVLQCIMWYSLLLCLFEYRAATLLIKAHFPGPTAASITQFEVDGDVISLDGRDVLLQTESETDNHGHIRVRIRKSTSSAPETSVLSSSMGPTPRPSNLSNADIFSVNTPLHIHEIHGGVSEATVAGVCHDIGYGYLSGSPRLSGYASSDVYSLQPTPRRSNFNELEATATPVWGRSPVTGGRICRQSPVVAVPEGPPGRCHDGDGEGSKHITASTSEKEISFRDCTKVETAAADEEGVRKEEQKMPGRVVVMKLILVVVGRKLFRNPNTYSSALGLLWSLISFKWNVGMPSLMKSSIKIISDAGLGMAMFSLGLFMALQERVIACGPKRAAMALAIRFVGGPLVMSAASITVGLRGPLLHTAIIQAALPQGIVPFVFAREYGLHPDILSTGVIFGMLVSLPVTLLYYIFLGL